MNDTPTLSPADRLSIILVMLVQALFAHAGIKLPASVLAMIEAQFRGIGEEFARLAASIEKGQPVPPRRARRIGPTASPRPTQAQRPKLPRRERVRTARALHHQADPLARRRRTAPRATYGPPIPTHRRHLPWHAHFVTIS